MQGLGNGAMRGIIPRAIEQVARYKQSLERDGWKYGAFHSSQLFQRTCVTILLLPIILISYCFNQQK